MLHTVLAVLGYTLLGLLVLVLALLCTPAGVSAELCGDAFTAQAHILCFSFRIWPLRQRDKKPKKKAEPAAESAAAKPKKKAPPLSLGQLARLADTAGGLMRLVLRCIHVRGVRAVWPVHRDDAAQTAIAFGRTQAYVGGALGVLQNAVDIRIKKIDIIPDFTGECKEPRYFYCKIQAIPLIMITAAAYAFLRLKAGKVI